MPPPWRPFADAGAEDQYVQPFDGRRHRRDPGAARHANRSMACPARGSPLASRRRRSSLMPDTPSRPERSQSMSSTVLAAMCFCCIGQGSTPRSTAPLRRPSISPSSAVDPIVVAPLRRSRKAHRRAPCPCSVVRRDMMRIRARSSRRSNGFVTWSSAPNSSPTTRYTDPPPPRHDDDRSPPIPSQMARQVEAIFTGQSTGASAANTRRMPTSSIATATWKPCALKRRMVGAVTSGSSSTTSRWCVRAYVWAAALGSGMVQKGIPGGSSLHRRRHRRGSPAPHAPAWFLRPAAARRIRTRAAWPSPARGGLPRAVPAGHRLRIRETRPIGFPDRAILVATRTATAAHAPAVARDASASTRRVRRGRSRRVRAGSRAAWPDRRCGRAPRVRRRRCAP